MRAVWAGPDGGSEVAAKGYAAAALAAKEARSYDTLLSADSMTTPAEVAAKYE